MGSDQGMLPDLPDDVVKVIRDVIDKLEALIVCAPPKRKRTSSKESSRDIAEGIQIFNTMHATKFGRMPYLTTGDKMMLGKMHRELPDFREIVAAFLNSNDSWIVKNGYAPRFIPSQVEALRKVTLPIPVQPGREWK